ncbi:MAG: hypothetical protein D9V47_10310 [Clostridia bacterium]|nr:MAG: hypothetical protein D9V47_10310 [Clostridia bacterium]
MGEYLVRISLSELRYLTATCPACGAQVTFDLARANNAVHWWRRPEGQYVRKTALEILPLPPA